MVVASSVMCERLFANSAATAPSHGPLLGRVGLRLQGIMPGMFGGYQGTALNQLLVVMDGMDEPPALRKFFTNRVNNFLDAMFVVPSEIRGVSLRLSPPKPQPEPVYSIGP